MALEEERKQALALYVSLDQESKMMLLNFMNSIDSFGQDMLDSSIADMLEYEKGLKNGI